MNELNEEYHQRIDRYNQLIADALDNPGNLQRNFDQIRRLNAEINTILDKMMGQFAMVRKNDANFVAQRDQLYRNLQRIQKEANALAQDKDTLETLRRIREFDESENKSSLNMYVVAFLILALVVLLVLVFKRPAPQSDITTTIPNSPAAMPAFT